MLKWRRVDVAFPSLGHVPWAPRPEASRSASLPVPALTAERPHAVRSMLSVPVKMCKRGDGTGSAEPLSPARGHLLPEQRYNSRAVSYE
ncbi:hypothetical protein EYF80_045041 [Liparis tanakae]|uniref:Uncharacterized protein n=1 Tax=Liparis tanakae TaxID=230148 RepID=A0A4Z2FUP8_9TELE|nr:hypothetical protein EYF80_045041 [Liparis tanakae]